MRFVDDMITGHSPHLIQVSETVFDTINHEYDKTEQKRAKQKKAKFGTEEKDSDCILHGYIKKLVNSYFL